MAYFVGATRVEVVDQGMFYLYAGTAPVSATAVVAEMRLELERLRAGKFGAEEIADAKRRMRVSRRQGRQSAGARMQGALVREVAGLGANFDAEWERRMALTDEVRAGTRRPAQGLIRLPRSGVAPPRPR
jgi:predicted Zn-dependent peptidase